LLFQNELAVEAGRASQPVLRLPNWSKHTRKGGSRYVNCMLKSMQA